jgi:hypothetical protein
MESTSKFRAAGGTVTYLCRPEDSEEYASRLEWELGRAVRVGLNAPSRRYASR